MKKKVHQLQVRVPLDQLNKLQRLSFENKITLSKQVRLLIENS